MPRDYCFPRPESSTQTPLSTPSPLCQAASKTNAFLFFVHRFHCPKATPACGFLSTHLRTPLKQRERQTLTYSFISSHSPKAPAIAPPHRPSRSSQATSRAGQKTGASTHPSGPIVLEGDNASHRRAPSWTPTCA